jgi:hypothetical protein
VTSARGVVVTSTRGTILVALRRTSLLTPSRLGVVLGGFALGTRLEQNLSVFRRLNDLFPGRKLRIQLIAIQLLLYITAEAVPNFNHLFFVVIETRYE